ncbi:hypothetical protein L195_g041389, partial [Trifolium pratense]
ESFVTDPSVFAFIHPKIGDRQSTNLFNDAAAGLGASWNFCRIAFSAAFDSPGANDALRLLAVKIFDCAAFIYSSLCVSEANAISRQTNGMENMKNHGCSNSCLKANEEITDSFRSRGYFVQVSPLPFKVIEKVLKDNLGPDFSKMLFQVILIYFKELVFIDSSLYRLLIDIRAFGCVLMEFVAINNKSWSNGHRFIQHRSRDLVYGLRCKEKGLCVFVMLPGMI